MSIKLLRDLIIYPLIRKRPEPVGSFKQIPAVGQTPRFQNQEQDNHQTEKHGGNTGSKTAGQHRKSGFAKPGSGIVTPTPSRRIKTTPRIGPRVVPSPPMIIMPTKSMESIKRKVVRADRTVPMGQQGTGNSGQETTDEESQHFVVEKIDSHHFGRQIIIPDGDKSPPDPGPGQILGQKDDRSRQYR